MSNWMKGQLPTRENLKALANVFLRAGLSRYTDIYLERGDGHPERRDYIEPATEPEADGRERERKRRA